MSEANRARKARNEPFERLGTSESLRERGTSSSKLEKAKKLTKRAKRGRKRERSDRKGLILDPKAKLLQRSEASKAKLLGEGRRLSEAKPGRSEASLPVSADSGRFRRNATKSAKMGQIWLKIGLFGLFLAQNEAFLIDFHRFLNFLFRPKMRFSIFFSGPNFIFGPKMADFG